MIMPVLDWMFLYVYTVYKRLAEKYSIKYNIDACVWYSILPHYSQQYDYSIRRVFVNNLSVLIIQS